MPHRRTLLATALAATLGVPAARAEQLLASLFVMVPANPGGGWDSLGRAIEQVARPAGLVGSFQFENVGGAGGTLGLTRFVSTRRGRGDALMVAGSVMVGAVLTNKTPVSLQDVTPVARLTEEADVLVVPAQSPFRDLRALLDAMKANPGQVSMAGGSAGGTDHICLGLMLKALGRNAREGSYVAFAGGGAAQAAILGAQVSAGLSGYSEFSEQIKAGRMRALATTGAQRTDPAIPTLRESGLDVVATNWRGVFAAPGVRPDARAKLVAVMTAMHALPAWRELLATRGWADAFLTGAEFDSFLVRDRTQTEAVLKDIGLA
jgi:putative tricarboxylic transport membrane protein